MLSLIRYNRFISKYLGEEVVELWNVLFLLEHDQCSIRFNVMCTEKAENLTNGS